MEVAIEFIKDFGENDEEGVIAREEYKSSRKVLKYLDLMRKGVKFPPISILKNGSLMDGMHRLTAYRLLGTKRLEVEIENI